MVVTRESILQLAQAEKIADATAHNLVGQFESNFSRGFGEEIPPNAKNALDLVKKALDENREKFFTAVVTAYENLLGEEVISSALAFRETLAGKKLVEVGEELQQKISNAADDWCNDAIRVIEPELAKLLG